jgi:hypothetical protein
MRWAIVPALLVAAHASAEVQVQVTNGRVSVQAAGAPLSDVLERLARQTGMKVTYDGPPQRTPVNLTLADRTPAQAVLGVLDGLGLNYALRMDQSGTRIETLLIAGTAPTAPAGSLAAAPASRPVPAYRPPEPVESDEPEEEEPIDEEPETEDAVDAAPGAPTLPSVLPGGMQPPGVKQRPGAAGQPNGQAPVSRAFGPGVLGTATPPEFPIPPFLGNRPPAPQAEPPDDAEPDDDTTQ